MGYRNWATPTMISAALMGSAGFAGAKGTGTGDPGPDGVGMIGVGWDGPGQNATTVYFHFENSVPTRGPAQRTQFIEILEDWASVVQIHFVEIAVPNAARSIDLLWADGDHCANEPSECGIAACSFVDSGSLAHGAYPPGIETICGGISTESRAGNIHLNSNLAIQTNPDNAGYSYKLLTAKMVGHALGLQPVTSDTTNTVMGRVEWNENYIGIRATDAAQIEEGYAPGVGSVTTLDSLGVWVNSNWFGQERGTPQAPVNTIAEGFAGVPPYSEGVVMHVQAGLYPGAITIDRPCVITSEFGTAFIGE